MRCARCVPFRNSVQPPRVIRVGWEEGGIISFITSRTFRSKWYESRCSRTTAGDYSQTTCILPETRDVIYVRVKLNARTYRGPRHDNAGIENEGLTDRCYLERLHNGPLLSYRDRDRLCHIHVYINEQLDYENHLDKSPFQRSQPLLFEKYRHVRFFAGVTCAALTLNRDT